MIFRVEDKYTLTESEMYLLEKRIGFLMKPDRGPEGYSISSLYFDDICDSMLKDSLDGNPSRDKYRIRIYNDSVDIIKLEVKRKQYNRAVKISSLISPKEMHMLCDGECISCRDDLNDARTLFNLAIKERLLRPRVIVTYDRHAYLSEEGNVRVTFDRNVRACNRIELFSTKGLVYDYPEGNGSVLEVKYDELIPRPVMQVLENAKMIQTANSKYGMCRQIYEERRTG